jgi:hypothetical protein
LLESHEKKHRLSESESEELGWAIPLMQYCPQEHVGAAKRREGCGSAGRVPDRAGTSLQQVQEEDRQEVPGGRSVGHVHHQQVNLTTKLIFITFPSHFFKKSHDAF